MTIDALAEWLRTGAGVRHKLDIRQAYAKLGPTVVPVGHDCAAISDGEGFLPLAIEGLLDSFVEAEPWFAGYCVVMVNLSDAAAMDGRPIAIVDAIWTAGADRAGPISDGTTAAATRYGVPFDGGHTNARDRQPSRRRRARPREAVAHALRSPPRRRADPRHQAARRMIRRLPVLERQHDRVRRASRSDLPFARPHP